MTKDKLTYNEAVAEIEGILEQIEEGQLDVDELSEKVSRVARLLKICQDKLQHSEKEISKILEEDQDSENEV